MEDFKLRGKCLGCRKTRWFVRKRRVSTPIGTVTSQGLICSTCYSKLLGALNTTHNGTKTKKDSE